LASFDEGGLVFSYPADWRVFRYEENSSFSHLIAYLATVDVDSPCTTTRVAGHTETDCSDHYQLAPDEIVVTVMSAGMPAFSIMDTPEGATPLTIGGLPAYSLPESSAGATRTLTWHLARPGSIDNFYRISATIQGPDFDELQAPLEASLASLRYDPPVVPLPIGLAASNGAALKALGILAAQDSAWTCFPPPGATRDGTITAVPMGPALHQPQRATCTTAIEATPLQLWRMTLVLRLSAADPEAGAGSLFTVWVNPDGTPGATGGGPLPDATPAHRYETSAQRELVGSVWSGTD
jgi:hypothetical protein